MTLWQSKEDDVLTKYHLHNDLHKKTHTKCFDVVAVAVPHHTHICHVEINTHSLTCLILNLQLHLFPTSKQLVF